MYLWDFLDKKVLCGIPKHKLFTFQRVRGVQLIESHIPHNNSTAAALIHFTLFITRKLICMSPVSALT